jgi:hypothetical protein
MFPIEIMQFKTALKPLSQIKMLKIIVVRLKHWSTKKSLLLLLTLLQIFEIFFLLSLSVHFKAEILENVWPSEQSYDYTL